MVVGMYKIAWDARLVGIKGARGEKLYLGEVHKYPDWSLTIKNIIAESAPFVPNIFRLSDRIGINRQTLIAYLHYLTEARLINLLYKEARGIGALTKPDKIFLENGNLMHLFAGGPTASDRGTEAASGHRKRLGRRG